MAIHATAGARVGDYILARKLGEGGMAEVWLARHQTTAQLRAIKFLNSQFQGIPEVEARFQNEGESKLVHPNIVRVFEVGQESGSSYLVMEFVDGQDLENILNSRRGPLTVPEALDIGMQILAGIGFAHSHGIVHRDIKPSNVLVDREGHAFVMDFGIAKVLRTGRMLTQVNSRLGTPDYMSPEQIRNPRDVDHRSDIYSFGCLFYELLTGWPPFDRGEGYETEHDIKTAHVSLPPTPPILRKTGLPAELNQITLRCLEKSKDDRPQSCEEISGALNIYRASLPRSQPQSRSATIVEYEQPLAGPGLTPRRETVVIHQVGSPATSVNKPHPQPEIPPAANVPTSPVRTPTVIDVSQNPSNVFILGPPGKPPFQVFAPPELPKKGAPRALIAAGLLMVLVALAGGGWAIYHKHQEDAEAARVDEEAKRREAENSKPTEPSSRVHPPATTPGKPLPDSTPPIAPRRAEAPKPESRRVPIGEEQTHSIPTQIPPAPLSGTLIWSGDATATRGHVTIVRSGNFAMPGGQLTGAMFPASPLRVRVRTPGATVQLPKQQTSYNSLDVFLPSPGQQTVYIDWTALPYP